MKKYLVTGLAAVAISGMFTSCTHDTDGGNGNTNLGVVETYEKAFISRFGTPSADADWGFGPTTAQAGTRANAIISGDPFTFENTNDYYIETVDESKYVNLSTIENLNQRTDTEWIVTENFPKINFYEGHHTFYIKGNVSMHDQAYMYDATFYVLKNSTLTLSKTANYNTVIYVADGATLNYNVEKLERNPQGGEKKNAIYNQGTVNLASNFKLSNGSIFYNEGNVYGTNITSAPADGDPSFFYNFGTVELTGKHQLNSDASFYNEGTFTVSGETELTQGNKQIWWINKDKYTTGSFKTAAWNGTMYNFCSLFVTGDAMMSNGQFFQMNGSYMEADHGVFSNFQFVMENGSGINIKSGSLWNRDGADFRGTYTWGHQGFVAVDDNAKVWVRLGGSSKILDHKGSAFHVEGANMTFGYDDVKFYSTMYYWSGDWNNTVTKFADESTAESLADKKSENTTWNLHNVTKVYTGDDFSQVTATPKTNDCGATWTPDDNPPVVSTLDPIRVIAEDMGDQSLNENSDFDFNDVVFDVTWVSDSEVDVEILAAGGTLPLTVGWDGVDESKYRDFEVHNLLGYSETMIINTHSSVGNHIDGVPSKHLTLNGTFSKDNFAADVNTQIPIKVKKNGVWYDIKADQGKVAGKLAVDKEYEPWCNERKDIDDWWINADKQGLFLKYTQDPTTLTKYWYKQAKFRQLKPGEYTELK